MGVSFTTLSLEIGTTKLYFCKYYVGAYIGAELAIVVPDGHTALYAEAGSGLVLVCSEALPEILIVDEAGAALHG